MRRWWLSRHTYPVTRSVTQATSAAVTPRLGVHYTLTSTATQATSLLLGTSAVNLPTDYYTTVFPSAENPISEGNVWTLGGRDALDWTSPRTVTNKVFGTQTGTDSPPYTDSIAVIKGTWGNDQEATATVFNTLGSSGSEFCEAELLLRFTIAPHAVTGYEITLNTNPSQNYIQVNRWTGGPGGSGSSYVQIASTGGTVVNGDVVKATIIGSTIRVYVNGTQVLTVTDATYTTGRPGVGFFYWDQGLHLSSSAWGFTRVTLHTVGAPIPLSRSVGVGQVVQFARKPFLTRALTQTQSATLRRQSLLSRLLSVAEAVSITRGSGAIARTVSAIAQTAVSIQVRQVKVQTLTVLQGLSATVTRQLRVQRTVSETILPLLQQQVRLPRTVPQGNHLSISSGSTTAYSQVVVTSVPVAAFVQYTTTPGTPITPPTPLPPFPFEDAPSLVPVAELSAPALGPEPVGGAPSLLPVP